MRYSYSVGAPGRDSKTAYLLQKAPQDAAVTILVSAYINKGKRFRNFLAPYVKNRADSLQLLDDRSIGINELPKFVHVLNSDQPFSSDVRILDGKLKRTK